MSDLVLVHVEDRVALMTINDPDRRNAVTADMSAALRGAIEEAEDDPGVHAVIVTGAGKAFCAGADLTELGAATEDGLRDIYDGFLALADCSLPTIAAVNGPAVGAGFNVALAADVRIAGPTALFDPRFQTLGIHPGGGATWMLQRAVGPQVARASLLFGMRFDADSAVEHGLALKIADDPVAAARELAAGLRRRPAVSSSPPRRPCGRPPTPGPSTSISTAWRSTWRSDPRRCPSNHLSSQRDWPRNARRRASANAASRCNAA